MRKISSELNRGNLRGIMKKGKNMRFTKVKGILYEYQ